MKFRKKENGHIEAKPAPGVWCFFFGMLYFLVSGIWIHALVMFLLCVFFFTAFGSPGILFVFAAQVVYCFLAPGIVRNHYLRQGWEEITDTAETGNVSSPVAPKNRACPYCGEDVLAVAIKCKHCQSTIEPLES